MTALNREIVVRFARALDEEDYDAASALLDAACVYDIRGERHCGPDAIIASYRSAGEWVRETFDAVAYESAVRLESDPEFVIEFADLLTHAGVHHRHECEQRVRVDGDRKIVRIEHIDLPGETERLSAYLTRVGVER